MALVNLTAAAVIQAIKEFDKLGRDPFLHKYGFKNAREYFLIYEGRHYASKAIAGAAHGYLSGQKPLVSREFSGGEFTVSKTLTKLGFTVENITDQFNSLSDMQLKQRALKAPKKPASNLTEVISYTRNPAVAAYAKRLARGQCALCARPGPFSKFGEPYLECHHIVWLAKDGGDTIENTVALCPNCHRKMHLLDLKEDREKLANWVKKRLAE